MKKWLKSDFCINALSSALTQGATFLAAIIAGRILERQAFGHYSIGVSLVATTSSLFAMGLALSLNAQVAGTRRASAPDASDVARYGVVIAALFGVLGAALLLLGAPVMSAELYDDQGTADVIRVVAATLPFAVVALAQGGALAGFGRFRSLAVGAACQFVVTCFAVWWGALNFGAIGALFGFTLGFGVRAVVGQIELRKATMAGALSVRSAWRTILASKHVAIPAALSGATTFPAMLAANAALVASSGASAFGAFAIATLVKSAVTFLPLQLGAVLLSRGLHLRSGGQLDEARAYARRAFGLAFALTAPVAVVVALLPPSALALLGDNFAQAQPLIAATMMLAVLEPLGILAGYELAARGLLWRSFWTYALPKDLILVAGAWVLTPRLGATGLIVAYGLSWSYALVAALIASHMGPTGSRRTHAATPQA